MLTPKATNVVIMDMSGIDAVIALRTQFPDARTNVLTTFGCGAEIKTALAGAARKANRNILKAALDDAKSRLEGGGSFGAGVSAASYQLPSNAQVIGYLLQSVNWYHHGYAERQVANGNLDSSIEDLAQSVSDVNTPATPVRVAPPGLSPRESRSMCRNSGSGVMWQLSRIHWFSYLQPLVW
jgi:DNA-binding NarL/FixJ family response regulator